MVKHQKRSQSRNCLSNKGTAAVLATTLVVGGACLPALAYAQDPTDATSVTEEQSQPFPLVSTRSFIGNSVVTSQPLNPPNAVAGTALFDIQARDIPAGVSQVTFKNVSSEDETMVFGQWNIAVQNGVAKLKVSDSRSIYETARYLRDGYIIASYQDATGATISSKLRIIQPRPSLISDEPEIKKDLSPAEMGNHKHGYKYWGGLVPNSGVRAVFGTYPSTLVFEAYDDQDQLQWSREVSAKNSSDFSNEKCEIVLYNLDNDQRNYVKCLNIATLYKLPERGKLKLYSRMEQTALDGKKEIKKSPAQEIEILPAPRLDSPTVDTFIKGDKVLTGTGTPGQTIRILIPGIDTPRYAIVNAEGKWSTTPNDQPSVLTGITGADSFYLEKIKGQQYVDLTGRDQLSEADLAKLDEIMSLGEETAQKITVVQQPFMNESGVNAPTYDSTNARQRFDLFNMGWRETNRDKTLPLNTEDTADYYYYYRPSADDDGTGNKPAKTPVLYAPTPQDKLTRIDTASTAGATRFVENTAQLPQGTQIAWKSTNAPDLSSAGEREATLEITYPSGRKVQVPTTYTVIDDKSLKSQVAQQTSVEKGTNYTASDPAKQKAYEDSVKAAKAVLANLDSTQDAINTALQDLQQKQAQLNGDQNIATAKQQAKSAIDAKLAEAIKAIDDAVALTPAQKATAKQNVTQTANTAKSNIDDATTIAEVTNRQTAGLTELDKDIAKNALEDKATQITKAIEADTNLSDEQKTSAKAEVEQDLATAKSEIDKASDSATVAQKRSAGELELDKDNAKAVIDSKLAEGNKAVESAQALSAEQKTAAKQQLEQDATSAKNEIDKASTTSAVQEQKTAGELALDKDIAKNELEDKATQITKAIEADTNLSDKQKTSAKAEVEQDLATAKSEIDKAQSLPQITNNKTAGELELDKDGAKAEIDAKVAEISKIIDESAMTEEQKSSAKQKLTQDANSAKAKIDAADDEQTLQTQVTDAKLTLDKDGAKANIDAKLAEAINAVEQAQGLTEQAKESAKQELKADAQKANEAIDQASDSATVAQKRSAGELELDKDLAKAQIDSKLAQANKAVENSSLLTPEEKETTKSQLQQTADSAKDNIEKATTSAGVKTQKEAGEVSLDRQIAKGNIEAKLAEGLKALENAQGLTEQAKESAKQELKQKANTAIAEIDKANNSVAIAEKQTAGELELDKQIAKNYLDDKATQITKAIEADTNLSDEQKASAKAEVEQDLATAKAEIDKASDSATVAQKRGAGELELDKDGAKAEIDGNLSKALAKLDTLGALSQEHKQATQQALQNTANEAKSAIDRSASVAQITDVKTPAVVKLAQQISVDEIENKLIENSKVIDGAQALTAEQKASAKQELSQIATDAKSNIEKTTTVDTVYVSTEEGKFKLDKQFTFTDLENKAKLAIDNVENSKDLTAEQKAVAKEAVAQALKKATALVQGANNYPELRKVKLEIDDIISKSHELAKQAVEKANKVALVKKQELASTGVDQQVGILSAVLLAVGSALLLIRRRKENE